MHPKFIRKKTFCPHTGTSIFSDAFIIVIINMISAIKFRVWWKIITKVSEEFTAALKMEAAGSSESIAFYAKLHGITSHKSVFPYFLVGEVCFPVCLN
jgi:hypothetical protein